MIDPNSLRVGVLGAGSFGTALANVLADNGHQVTLWARDEAVVQSINEGHTNPKYLKGTPLSPGIRATNSLNEVTTIASTLVCAIPTQKIRGVLTPVAEKLASKLIVNAAKGIEMGTLKTVSGILSEIAPSIRYAILSGPSFASELVQRLPTAVTLATTVPEVSNFAQKLFSNRYFRVYSSTDVVGVELAGALKNVIAIGSGVVSGLKLGYNAQAAIINRGVAEMTRMAAKLKAQPMTFLGLAGMGDLVLTCTGPLSRNRIVGTLLGEGKPLAQIEIQIGGVAEGIATAKSTHELSKKLQVEMPITEQVYKILYEGQTCKTALEELMNRDPKVEWS